jgi:hypothetical protein
VSEWVMWRGGSGLHHGGKALLYRATHSRPTQPPRFGRANTATAAAPTYTMRRHHTHTHTHTHAPPTLTQIHHPRKQL